MRFTLIAAGTLLAAAAEAQQQPGVLSHPAMSPVLPDFIAYEKIVNDRGELWLRDLATGKDFSATQVVGAVSSQARNPFQSIVPGRNLRSYAGMLDWRPVVDSRGRAWFAYVESNATGTTELKLNFVDRNGARGDQAVSVPGVRVQPRYPRWSRDGRHLAFVSDSGMLMLALNVTSVLQERGAPPVEVLRVATANVPAFFPAWSPDGKFIAYGTDVVSRGAKNGAIEVHPVNAATGRPEGTKVVVTSALVADNEYRPSWSPGSNRLAFYADQAGLGNGLGLVSIGIVDLEMNERTGQLFRGVVKQGLRRWIAENVIPDETRGPQWARVPVGTQPQDAIHYVHRGDSLVVKVAAVDSWLAQLATDGYEVVQSGLWEASSPKALVVTPMNQVLRYAFTDVEGGGDVVRCYDMRATYLAPPLPTALTFCGARGGVMNPVTQRFITEPAGSARAGVSVATAPPTTPTGVRESARPTAPPTGATGPVPAGFDASITVVNPQKNLGYALLFPGLGQFSAGAKTKGITLLVAGVASAGFAYMSASGTSDPASKAQSFADAAKTKIGSGTDPASERAEFNTLKSQYDSKVSSATMGAGLFGAMYVYGMIDAYFGNRGRTARMRVSPVATTDMRGDSRIGVAIPFGRRR